jgi:hypothetical protein
VHRSTSGTRRACAVGTTIALVGLTTGLGVFGVSAASAAELPSTSATSTAVAATDATPAASTAPSAPAATDTPTTATDAATGAPTTAATDTPTADPSTPAASAAPAVPAATTPPAGPAAAAPTVTLSSTEAKVGQTLVAKPTGFTGALTYAWTNSKPADKSQGGNSYLVTADDAGYTLTVTVTDTLGQTATATTESVTEDPAFAGPATSEDSPLALTATVGTAFSHTFTATGVPAPTYALAWFDPEYADPSDPTDTPESQLPDGMTFDASTGVLSVTDVSKFTSADVFDFAVTATSGDATATQYAELTVQAGPAVGVEVFTADKKTLDTLDGDGTGSATAWIIEADGAISTVHVTSDADGDSSVDVVDGGQPTVHQGGTLAVEGGLVDRFDNQVTDADGNVALPTVTSNYASDVIKTETDDEFGDTGLVDVTFPHASTHTLSVAIDAFVTSFPVTVVPNGTAVAPVVTTVPTTTTGELAFTGSDTTGALPWALGLLAAGLGLTGLRIGRRRAQR